MRRPALGLVCLLPLLCACGRAAAPIPETDLLVRVEIGARAVDLGKAFPVTVTRVWEKDLDPSPWDDASLSPLVVRLEERTQREDDARVEETWRYRGYAFALDDVRIPPIVFVARARDGGGPRLVKTDALRLRVRTALAPDDASEPELPGALRAEGGPGRAWVRGGGILLLLGLVLGGAILALRRRAAALEPPPVVREEAFETPASRALAALERISETSPADAAARGADVARAADVLRDYVGEAFEVPARRRTSEEVLAGGAPAPVARLRAVLSAADRVKFAAGAASAAERRRVLDDAERYVEESERGEA